MYPQLPVGSQQHQPSPAETPALTIGSMAPERRSSSPLPPPSHLVGIQAWPAGLLWSVLQTDHVSLDSTLLKKPSADF